jgi:hypothetical protein
MLLIAWVPSLPGFIETLARLLPMLDCFTFGHLIECSAAARS